MYVKSYNQAHGTPTYLGASYRDDSTLDSGAGFYRTQGYIYTINGNRPSGTNSYYYTASGSLDNENFNCMYCGEVTDSCPYPYWWISSPSAARNINVCRVSCGERNLRHNSNNSNSGVCPLVSLRSDFTLQISE